MKQFNSVRVSNFISWCDVWVSTHQTGSYIVLVSLTNKTNWRNSNNKRCLSKTKKKLKQKSPSFNHWQVFLFPVFIYEQKICWYEIPVSMSGTSPLYRWRLCGHWGEIFWSDFLIFFRMGWGPGGRQIIFSWLEGKVWSKLFYVSFGDAKDLLGLFLIAIQQKTGSFRRGTWFAKNQKCIRLGFGKGLGGFGVVVFLRHSSKTKERKWPKEAKNLCLTILTLQR